MSGNAMVVKQRVPKTAANPKGTRDLDVDSLDRRPLSKWYEVAGQAVNLENHIYHATALFDAGTAITTAHVVELFTSGAKQPLLVPNTNRVIPIQGEFLTNMVNDGRFDNGTSFFLSQISTDIFISSDRATTVTNGAIINPTINPLATFSCANHYQALSRQFGLRFVRSEDQEQVAGELYQFPSPFTASGAVGASVGGFIQNGYNPTWNKLREVHALKTNDSFRVEIRPLLDGFVPQVDIAIRVLFIGLRIRTFIA